MSKCYSLLFLRLRRKIGRITSQTASLDINEVDESILKKSYHARCLDCNFCRDLCCRHGCDVDVAEKERILAYKAELQKYLKVPASNWFQDKVVADAEYPSGKFVRTRVHLGKCVFYGHDDRGSPLDGLHIKIILTGLTQD